MYNTQKLKPALFSTTLQALLLKQYFSRHNKIHRPL